MIYIKHIVCVYYHCLPFAGERHYEKMSHGESIVAEFGTRFRALRKATGLIQLEPAERAALAFETISGMEIGK